VDDLARAHGVSSDVGLARVFAIISPQAPASMRLSAIELTDRQLLLTASGLDGPDTPPLMAALDAHGLRAQLQGGQLVITPKETR
jgi:hypothetical protein